MTATAARPIPDHGTRARYVSKAQPCRCTACRAAHREYHARYRPTTGTTPGSGGRTDPRMATDPIATLLAATRRTGRIRGVMHARDE